MSRKYEARLTRLEDQLTGPGVDLVGEAARYGEPLWSVDGFRCYVQQTEEGSRLAVVGAPAPLVYELVDADVRDLT